MSEQDHSTTPGLSDEQVRALVRDACAAPSMHNAQPWRFRYLRGSGEFQLRADPDRVLPHADPDRRALHLGCGAALFNLRVALAHLGRSPGIRLLPDPSDPDLLATVRAAAADSGDGDPGELAALHPAIPERHSSRFPFEETPLPEELRAALADAARKEGAGLAFPSPWHLEQVLDLMAEAEVRNKDDQGSEEDLARWTRPDAVSVSEPQHDLHDPGPGHRVAQLPGPKGPRTPRRPVPDVLDIEG
ncbi:hypothetical protein GCM10009535_02820 [Streptomyces thermocarboxydovorans]|uniref:Nitroreductase n=1 Tax=Streptomyces thermocarboxydovorans TaxID=59298 RepID=A0ABN1H7B2_9ACTN